jgi:uncharacterized membrane protein YqiK
VLFYRIPAPNEAMVVTGSKGLGGAQFRIVTGKGAFVWPWKSRARMLSLDLRQAQLNEPCVTKQGITLGVQAVAVFKVGNDAASITNAATRFLDQQELVAQTIGRVLAGHLRSIVGNMTVEEIIGSRNTLAQQVKDAASDEMQKMGLDIDAFQIQEILDQTGYIDNIASPHVAAVQRDARIAKAQADQAAAEKEQEAAAQVAQFTRDSQVRQAAASADVQAAAAKAAQAGPLAQAQASQEVIAQQTLLAEREAERRRAELVAEVQAPADAKAYETLKLAEAEGEANKARAAGLLGDNLDTIVATRMMDSMPELVKSIAMGLNGSNLTILNGAEGIGQLITGLVAQSRAVYEAVLGAVPNAHEPSAEGGPTSAAVAAGSNGSHVDPTSGHQPATAARDAGSS